MEAVDCTVIGAGVIGLAIAAELSQDRSVLILEKQPKIGSGISSRNSEVIHSGIYYPTNSLKTQLCVSGREQLYHFCQNYNIPYKKTGKLVVANQKSDIPQLQKLQQQAIANGVHNCCLLEKTDLQNYEPQLQATAALLCPDSGIIDSHSLMQALLGRAESQGAQLALNTQVTAIKQQPNYKKNSNTNYQITSNNGEFQFTSNQIINATGLDTWSISELLTNDWSAPERYLVKGQYCSYSGKNPFTHLIYPLPEQAGLGIHATLNLQGGIKFGPDISYINEENYQPDANSPAQFYPVIQRYFPQVEQNQLNTSYVGIRPKLQAPDESFTDFLFADQSLHGLPGVIHCLGIESPGLTACLAIAKHIRELLNN